MTLYLNQKQALGLKNQGMTGKGFEFKNTDHSQWGTTTEFKHLRTQRTTITGHQHNGQQGGVRLDGGEKQGGWIIKGERHGLS
jgi:hypothetical protein